MNAAIRLGSRPSCEIAPVRRRVGLVLSRTFGPRPVPPPPPGAASTAADLRVGRRRRFGLHAQRRASPCRPRESGDPSLRRRASAAEAELRRRRLGPHFRWDDSICCSHFTWTRLRESADDSSGGCGLKSFIVEPSRARPTGLAMRTKHFRPISALFLAIKPAPGRIYPGLDRAADQ